jgi:hypothetical protein
MRPAAPLSPALPLLLAAATVLPLLGGCGGGQPLPMLALNRQLERQGSSREPSLSGRWLALISSRGGREQVQLVDVERGVQQPLPGLNRPDAQPLSVSVDAAGERLALVRQLEGRTELVLYRRSVGSVRLLPITPAGVPRRVQLRADGRQLAVEVSRGGLWQIDLIAVP